MARKKKMPIFWRVFWIMTALFFLGLGIWLICLNSWLSEFESVQPKHLAEDTFDKYFKDFDAEEYVKMCSTEKGVLETTDNIVAYLESVTDGKEITYKKVSTGMDSGYKYVVLAGEEETKFASFMLVDDTKEGDKFTTYKADNFEIYTDSKHKVTVEAPKGYGVYINSTLLDESYVTENDVPTTSCDYVPEGVSGLYYTVYTVEGLLSTPTVTVKDQNGTETAVENTDNKYKASPVYDQALADEYSEWILEGVEKYAKYSQYDSNVNATGFNQVAPYFDPTSELYESIKTVDNMFVIHYDKYEFTDMKASEFYRYDENTFSCRVQYTQNLYKGNNLYDDFVDQTLYLRMVDGEYLIYEMHVN